VKLTTVRVEDEGGSGLLCVDSAREGEILVATVGKMVAGYCCACGWLLLL